MNFTLDELLNALKYHGHTYNLSLLEILEGLEKQREEELDKLEDIHEKEKDSEVVESLEEMNNETIKQLETLLESENLKDDLIEYIEHLKNKIIF